MNALDEYNRIIDFRRKCPVGEGVYVEKHHIIPKSLGGDNSKENLVVLLPQEHFICHKLLIEIYPTGDEHRKMLCALHRMCNTDKYVISSDDYALLRLKWHEEFIGHEVSQETRDKIRKSQLGKFVPKEVGEKISQANKGKIPWNKGKSNCYSDEARKRMSESHQGEKNNRFGTHHTEETKLKMRNAALGRHVSDETRKKMSEINKGKKMSLENKAKLLAAHLGKPRSEETKEKLRKAHLGTHLSEEVRNKIRETLKRTREAKKLAKMSGGGNISKEIGAEGKEELEKLEEKIKTDRSKGQAWAFV